MKVVITGGGTGGHIYPALSIAQQLRQSGAELLYIGSGHGPEGALAEQEGFRFIAVPSGPIAGMSLRTVQSLGKLSIGMMKAYSILRDFRPDVLVGTGGYTSAGVAFAEWMRHGRVVIHEQNSIPGRTNRFLARLARSVCVTFEESVRYFPAGKTIVTGLPVRPEIAAGMNKGTARKLLGLALDKFTVLVFGGSQGAKRLNEIVLDAIPTLLNKNLQVLHQTGKKNYDEVVSRQPEGGSYFIRPYIDKMAAAYASADLVVSRSGASSIAEITVCGLPAILVPYPYAQADHQTKNAEVISRPGAALVLEEHGATGSILAEMILDLIDDPARLERMAHASKSLGRPDATDEIVRVIQEAAGF